MEPDGNQEDVAEVELDEPPVPAEPLLDIFGDGEPVIDQVPAEPLLDIYGEPIITYISEDQIPTAMTYAQWEASGLRCPWKIWLPIDKPQGTATIDEKESGGH